jgi:ankyrin repeat protein
MKLWVPLSVVASFTCWLICDQARIPDPSGDALGLVAAAGDAPAVRRLIHAGASLSHQGPGAGFDAVMSATAAGHLDILAALLDAGAPADQRTPTGQSALTFAAGAFNNALPMTDLLIRHGADVNAASRFGFTSLDAATLAGHPGVVRRLLAAGADPAAARFALLPAPDDTADVLACRELIRRAIISSRCTTVSSAPQ